MRAETPPFTELDTAREIAPKLAARAREFELARKVAPELMQEIFDAGLVQMAIPAVYGGRESSLEEILLVIEEIAAGDASTAWCLMNYQTAAFVSGIINAPAANAIFGRSVPAVPAGVLAPTGRAREVNKGLIVNGRWEFASGCQHANWLMTTAIVEDESGQPISDETGTPRIIHPFVPREQVSIIDNWDVSGLCASGSHDVVVENAVIPGDHQFALSDPIIVDTPLYRFPIVSTFPPAVAMAAIGTARAALEFFVDLALHKTPTGDSSALRDRASAQIDVAKAEAMIDSARSYVLETVRSLWEDVVHGLPASVEKRRRVRLAGTYAAQLSANAADLLYTAGGSTSISLDCPLQRAVRDIRVITQHLQVSGAGFERMGQLKINRGIKRATLIVKH